MAASVFLKLLGGFLGLSAISSIPAGIIYSSKHTNINLLRNGNISQENLKGHCYKILSDDVNRKDLSVCKENGGLKYYLISGQGGGNRVAREIEKILTSGGVTVLGGNVIVKPKDSQNESLSGIKNKDDVMKTLDELKNGGLHNKCKSINELGIDSPKLTCSGGKSISLTKY